MEAARLYVIPALHRSPATLYYGNVKYIEIFQVDGEPGVAVCASNPSRRQEDCEVEAGREYKGSRKDVYRATGTE